jgi:hypothetical protein
MILTMPIRQEQRGNQMKYIKPAVRNSQPLHTVIHRNPGDIPGLVRAPRSGTFVNTTPEECQAITGPRADRWQEHMTRYINGEYGGNYGWDDMWNAMQLSTPIFGAYGERL